MEIVVEHVRTSRTPTLPSSDTRTAMDTKLCRRLAIEKSICASYAEPRTQ